MNEHRIQVIEITPEMIHEHDNADTLSIVEIDGFTVCTQTAGIGSVAAYIEPDSLVDTRLPEFDFLASEARYEADSTPNVDGHYARIKVKKLRGVPSMGLLVWMDPEIVKVGDDVTEVLGVEHYEPPTKLGRVEGIGDPKGWHPTYSSIENFRKPSAIKEFIPGEFVIATEKIHGANARYATEVGTGKLFVGSHKRWLKTDQPSAWLNVLNDQPGVVNFINQYAGYTVYGEIYGTPVQGAKASYGKNEVSFIMFDIMRADGSYVDRNELEVFGDAFKIPIVPIVYSGPFDSEVLTEAAEGTSPTHAGTVMEGLVIKPERERRGKKFNRVIAKLISTRYYLKSE